MELRLKDYGTIEITKATLVDGGDILRQKLEDINRKSCSYVPFGNNRW